MLEVYEATHVLIPMDITEEVVNSVAQKVSGSTGPGGTDSEALQGWIINFVDHSRKLSISVESFVDWMANKNPPWDGYRACMYGHLIALYNIPVVRPVGVGETFRRLFVKCVIKVT